jgi:indole-3-glycerol phosphate synthase
MSNESFLEKILSGRRKEVSASRAASDPQLLRQEARRVRAGKSPHRLRRALKENSGVNIIGEFKRASPSLGMIRAEADPADVVRTYEQAGVCALSILTEPEFFHGSVDDLRRARAMTELPILRKDFIVDEYQLDEAAVAGADAVLLIVASLADAELLRLRAYAEDELGLDALVEVHTAEELQRAGCCGAKLIGVNNRDLRTFVTILETSVQLASLAPPDVTLVSESGLSSPADIQRLIQCGYDGFLVGESLMRSTDPAALIRSLRGVANKELRHV